jgi:hypothetical protein
MRPEELELIYFPGRNRLGGGLFQFSFFLNSVHRRRILRYLEYQNVFPPSSELLPPPPTPSPASECVLPLEPKGEGGQHSLAGEGAGGANSNDWRESLAGTLSTLVCAHKTLRLWSLTPVKYVQ